MDTAWLPGAAAAVPATVHTLWLRRRFRMEVVSTRDQHMHALRNLEKERLLLVRERRAVAERLNAQSQHGFMLWPRPWHGGRPLTQAEEIVNLPGDPDLSAVPPELQYQRMRADAQELLDSYK